MSLFFVVVLVFAVVYHDVELDSGVGVVFGDVGHAVDACATVVLLVIVSMVVIC